VYAARRSAEGINIVEAEEYIQMGGKFNLARLRRYAGDGSIVTLSSSYINSGFSGSFTVSIPGTFEASGSNQATARALTTGSYFYLVTSTDPAKGAILQSGHAVLGSTVVVCNNAASSSFKLYPPVSGSIGSGSANAAFVVAPGMAYQFICHTTGSAAKWAVLGNVSV
jgi:hypothetical protein